MTDGISQGGSVDSNTLARNSRLFAIQLSEKDGGPAIAYAIAERVYFLTPEMADGSNVGGFSYRLLTQLFDEAKPELVARAIPLQASSDQGHRGLTGEVNPEVNLFKSQVND